MKIITFYSFKGGVGRTALLTNLGIHWSALGQVVALMDLDLAAPGLSYSPLLGDYLDSRGSGLGMVDLLNVFRRDIKSDEISLLPPHYLLRDMPLPPGHAPNGRLLAIGAGEEAYQSPRNRTAKEESAIPNRTPDADEKEDYEQIAFRALAEHLRNDLAKWQIPDGLAQGRGIDLLLIDARTGFSELRDLSLGYLADRIVLVSGLNEQNLRGLELTLEALKQRRVQLDEFPLAITLVFSPVPAGEDRSVLEALERGHREVAHALRRTRSGGHESAPPTFQLHYTPLLATSDYPPLLSSRKSLYAREVASIAAELVGSSRAEDQDEMLQEIRRKVLRLTASPRSPTAAHPSRQVDHPLADLPGWRWPCHRKEEGDRCEDFVARLRPAPGVVLDKEGLLNRLAWSLSLSLEEKRVFMDEFSAFSQARFDWLLEMLEEERQRSMAIWADTESVKGRGNLIAQYVHCAQEWATLLLDDARSGVERLAERLLEKHSAFARWHTQPTVWALLASELVNRERMEMEMERVRAVLSRGAVLAAPPEEFVGRFLAGIDRAVTTRSRWDKIVAMLKAVVGDTLGEYLIKGRYRDHGDGSVTDIQTGLQWMRCAIGQEWREGRCQGEARRMSWKEARALTVSFAGYKDWRLPTREELHSLVYCSSGEPDSFPGDGLGCSGDYQRPTLVEEAFPSTPEWGFWSSSAYSYYSSGAWYVYFNFGYGGNDHRDDNYAVRLVRGGQ